MTVSLSYDSMIHPLPVFVGRYVGINIIIIDTDRSHRSSVIGLFPSVS